MSNQIIRVGDTVSNGICTGVVVSTDSCYKVISILTGIELVSCSTLDMVIDSFGYKLISKGINHVDIDLIDALKGLFNNYPNTDEMQIILDTIKAIETYRDGKRMRTC